MDDITKVARAYYEGAAEDEKKLAREFFQSLDANRDGKVNYGEYKELVNPCFKNTRVFQELDRNGDGTLDFHEVLALYYMDKVSIPRCNGCENLLMDTYFACLPCQAETSYYLCCKCYGGRKFNHHHSSHEFMDTRAMLKLLDQLLKQAEITSQPEFQSGTGGDEQLEEKEATRSDTLGELVDGKIPNFSLDTELKDEEKAKEIFTQAESSPSKYRIRSVRQKAKQLFKVYKLGVTIKNCAVSAGFGM